MEEKAITGIMIVYAAIFAGLLVGWVMNIATLIGISFGGNEIEVILRALGIVFFPLGGVMGWF